MVVIFLCLAVAASVVGIGMALSRQIDALPRA